jgi:hypothetical protein
MGAPRSSARSMQGRWVRDRPGDSRGVGSLFGATTPGPAPSWAPGGPLRWAYLLG